jgi:hypothetical protein
MFASLANRFPIDGKQLTDLTKEQFVQIGKDTSLALYNIIQLIKLDGKLLILVIVY